MHLHHAVVFVADADASLAFYRDGLGLAVLVDKEFDGDWPVLFGTGAERLRAIILGDLENLELGQVELLTFADPVRPGPGVEPPRTGSMMLSFFVDLEKVLPAVEAFGGTDVRRSTLKNGTAIASVRDPDGVLVELLDAARRAGS